MSICTHCDRPGCKPVYYHLCPGCMGEGCLDCEGNLIPGIVPGEVEEGGNIGVCTEWSDPTVGAAIDGQHESLIEALTACRDSAMAEQEEADEAL